MKVRALVSIDDVTKGKLYEVKYKRNTGGVYIIDDGSYPYYLKEGEFEFVDDQPTLKEQYLVSGNVVELRNGSQYLVVSNTLMNLDGDNWGTTSSYTDNLTHGHYLHLDIIKVYIRKYHSSFFGIEPYSNLKLIWERNPKVKEVTMEDALNVLEQHYGCKVKVVK